MPIRTSLTDPLRVDFLDSEAHGWRGKLGLTFAPGKTKPDGWTGHWQRDLATDLQRLRDFYGVDTLVSLIEEHEFAAVKITNLREQVPALGMRSVWFPIRDVSIPNDVPAFVAVVREILGEVAAGKTVVVHCMGGLGRAGLTAACCLAAHGVTGDEAILEVRRSRRNTVETIEQENFVRAFADFCR